MVTQEMKDKGIHCKGQGFNCYNCKDKNECVEYVECEPLKQSEYTHTHKFKTITDIKEIDRIREHFKKKSKYLMDGKEVYIVSYRIITYDHSPICEAEYIECIECEPSKTTTERKVICPAIYKHFKSQTQPDKYIYATMGISEPTSTYPENFYQSLMGVYHTESNKEIAVFNIDGKWHHSVKDSNDRLVIYKSLYDGHMAYARPIEMFLSEVDHNKYPGVKQKHRFELVRY